MRIDAKRIEQLERRIRDLENMQARQPAEVAPVIPPPIGWVGKLKTTLTAGGQALMTVWLPNTGTGGLNAATTKDVTVTDPLVLPPQTVLPIGMVLGVSRIQRRWYLSIQPWTWIEQGKLQAALTPGSSAIVHRWEFVPSTGGMQEAPGPIADTVYDTVTFPTSPPAGTTVKYYWHPVANHWRFLVMGCW